LFAEKQMQASYFICQYLLSQLRYKAGNYFTDHVGIKFSGTVTDYV